MFKCFILVKGPLETVCEQMQMKFLGAEIQAMKDKVLFGVIN